MINVYRKQNHIEFIVIEIENANHLVLHVHECDYQDWDTGRVFPCCEQRGEKLIVTGIMRWDPITF